MAITSCGPCFRRSISMTRLTAQEKPGPFVLKCRTPGVPLDDKNLVWRAGAALWKALGRGGDPCDAVITIEKGIPLEAGLGGGSADAAAGLHMLARLWGGAPLSLLREVASGIGSDVPFFLSGGTALGLGRGEEIYPLVDLPRHWIVVVLPPFGVSTAEAYAWYDEDRAAGVREPRGELQILPGSVADAGGADDQRPGAAGLAPASRDRGDQGGLEGSRGGGRGDVGQRLGCLRPVPYQAGRRADDPAALTGGRRSPPQPDAVARRTRAARPSDRAQGLTPG